MDIPCRQCAGKVVISEDSRYVACEYCGSRLFVSLGRGSGSYVVKPLLDDQAAIDTLVTQLRNRGGCHEVSITQVAKLLVPFRVPAKDHASRATLAAPIAVGLESIATPQGDREFFEPGCLAGWDHLEPAQAQEESGDADLVYYPLFRLDYEYGGRIFQMCVDAVKGTAIADELPTFQVLGRNVSFLVFLVVSLVVYVVLMNAIPASLVLQLVLVLAGLAGLSVLTEFVLRSSR